MQHTVKAFIWDGLLQRIMSESDSEGELFIEMWHQCLENMTDVGAHTLRWLLAAKHFSRDRWRHMLTDVCFLMNTCSHNESFPHMALLFLHCFSLLLLPHFSPPHCSHRPSVFPLSLALSLTCVVVTAHVPGILYNVWKRTLQWVEQQRFT